MLRTDDSPADPLRRELLKLGVAGSVALSAVGLGAALGGCGRREAASAAGFGWLRDAEVALLRALIPAILDGALPPAGAGRDAQLAETLQRIDASAQRYGAGTQHALRQLFDLMNFAPTRRLLCGVGPWAQADAPALAQFLQRWRGSSVGVLGAGYCALTRMVGIAYYAMPATWRAAGYPGPLAWVYQGANA